MRILETSKKHEEYIINMRRHFHEYPELSGLEENTIARIAKELDEIGVEYVEIPNGGILAKINGSSSDGKAVLLRADCDALPVQESADNLMPGGRTCVSKNEGIMHACGHDGHTAMLLGASKVLKERQDEIQGTVYLCFERGEEGAGCYGHIFSYLDRHNIHIDSVYGTHLLATMDAGKMGINDEGMMAGFMWFEIEIEGRGGHGSRPDLANNPIDCFVAIYHRLEALRLTKISPYKTCTYSIGTLNAGTVGNVIPQTLSFSGSLRTLDYKGVGMKFRNEFQNVINKICEAYDCIPHYHYWSLPSPGVVNDAQCAQFARKVIGQELGDKNVTTCEPWLASESFGLYLMQWPGVFAFLGTKNEAIGVGADHHNPAFDIDESVLVKGTAAAVTYALEYLKAEHVTDSTRQMSFREYLEFSEQSHRIKEWY